MIRHEIAALLLFLLACPGSFAGPPSRAEWAETFVVESQELAGWIDLEYRFDHVDPAWSAGHGPTVCVDEWHFNRHTIGGIYWPFGELLRGDGYRVEPFRSLFRSDALNDCDILVIANPQAASNILGPGAPESNWAYPHASALTADEISAVITWVQQGGALFLISDHTPLAAAVADLGLLLGAHMLDGYTFASVEEMVVGEIGQVIFGKVDKEIWTKAVSSLSGLGLDLASRYEYVLEAPGELAPHPVVDGRDSSERIDWVITYTGQAFRVTDDWEPLLVLGPRAVSVAPWRFNFEGADGSEEPTYETSGWLQGATRRMGRGRVALLGDGNTCSAALDDVDGELSEPLMPEGFNDPRAPQHAQFCLNIVHWLSGLLDEASP